MKPGPINRATAASLRRYALAYSAFILVRCGLMLSNPRPIKTKLLVADAALVLGILIAMSLRYLRPSYGFIVIGIVIFELAYRDTLLKPLLLMEAALAILFGILVFRDNPKRS